MRLLGNRIVRTILLFAGGLALTFVLALVVAPRWPGLCAGVTVGQPCEGVAVQTAMGYLTIILGLVTLVLGPIAGSLIDLFVNGHKWETPRGPESATTNVPILMGVLYMVVGLALAASA